MRGFLKICLTAFMILAALGQSLTAWAEDRSYYNWGRVAEPNPERKTLLLYERGSDAATKYSYDKNTCFYRKEPGLKELKSDISRFKTGEPVVVRWVFRGKSRLAQNIWQRKAFFYKMAHLSTELLITGEIIHSANHDNTIRIKTHGGKQMEFKITSKTRTVINNRPGSINNLREGAKAAVFCTWRGFLEDKPIIPEASAVMDGRSYVIRSFTLEYGGHFTTGRVTGVNEKTGIIIIEKEKGIKNEVRYDGGTRWITASSRIKRIGDFSGQRVLIFGTNDKSAIKAQLVLNEPGVLSMFEMMARQGGSGTATTILARGPLAARGENHISIGKKEWDLRLMLVKSTRFYRGLAPVSINELKNGETLTVKGTLSRQPVVSSVTAGVQYP